MEFPRETRASSSVPIVFAMGHAQMSALPSCTAAIMAAKDGVGIGVMSGKKRSHTSDE